MNFNFLSPLMAPLSFSQLLLWFAFVSSASHLPRVSLDGAQRCHALSPYALSARFVAGVINRRNSLTTERDQKRERERPRERPGERQPERERERERLNCTFALRQAQSEHRNSEHSVNSIGFVGLSTRVSAQAFFIGNSSLFEPNCYTVGHSAGQTASAGECQQWLAMVSLRTGIIAGAKANVGQI